MTEKFIQKALFRLFQSHEFRFTNTYFFNNESDWLSFLNSGFCYECEIKISRSDFKADFKKERHVAHQANESGSGMFLRKHGVSKISNPSWELCREYPDLIESSEYVHRYRTSREPFFEERTEVYIYMNVSSKVEFLSHKNKMLPNKFFYVVPKGLIKKEEVPDYAGLIYVDENGFCTKIKDGKFLHKDKLEPAKLFKKTYLSYEFELYKKLFKS